MLRALCYCAHLDNVSLFEGQLILLGCRKVVQRNRLHFLTAQWPPIQDKAGTRKRTKGVNNNREKENQTTNTERSAFTKVVVSQARKVHSIQPLMHQSKGTEQPTNQPFSLPCPLSLVGGWWVVVVHNGGAVLVVFFRRFVSSTQLSDPNFSHRFGWRALKVKIDLLNCKRKAILAFDGDSYKKGKSRTKSTKPNQQTNNRVAFELN